MTLNDDKIGRAAYEASKRSLQGSGMIGSLLPLTHWHTLEIAVRQSYVDAANAAIKASGLLDPKRLPDAYVDAHFLSVEVTQREGDIRLSLQLAIAGAQRYNKKPGSSMPMIQDVLQSAQHSGAMLRLAAVAPGQPQMEASRLEDDGTLRELTEGEGTW